MLAIQKQPACRDCVCGAGRSKFIKKAIQLPNGSWAIVVFELIEANGKIVAKAVCGKIIEKNIPSQEEIIALPINFEKENFIPIKSPFFADVVNILKDLSFVISQPARAPNTF
ncbi:MAG: hypothetical protein ABIF22_02615 [bacterium]